MNEVEVIATEEKFVSQLPPKQRAIFMWLKKLLKLEKETAGQPVRAQVSWGLGKTTEEILKWELLIGDLPYPMIVEDRKSYSFQNTAAQQMDKT